MNENHSDTELKYISRGVRRLFEETVKNHAIVVLTGPRQVGKSTFLQHEPPLSTWRYVTMDNFDALTTAKNNPKNLWLNTDKIIIDEVQKAPELLSAVKEEVDQHRQKKKFILSGSANLLLMDKVSESLAGRAIYFYLGPLTYGEMITQASSPLLNDFLQGHFPKDKKFTIKNIDPLSYVLKGMMPTLLAFDHHNTVVQWWEGYVTTYLERDVRQFAQVESLPDFRKVMQLLAVQNGQIINQTEIARDAHVSQPSIHRYLNLLETTHLIKRLPSYINNRKKRLVKSPKVYWFDSGIACYLSGIYDLDSLRHAREAGAFFEGFVLQHLEAATGLMTPKAKLFYWRTQLGEEVDFILEWGRKILAIEVKLSPKVHSNDFSHLRQFLNENPNATAGLVVYPGNEIKQIDQKIFAVPWYCL